MKKISWRLSSKQMTVLIKTNSNGIIVEAAPIVKRFVGQTLTALKYWMKKQGGFEIKRIKK